MAFFARKKGDKKRTERQKEDRKKMGAFGVGKFCVPFAYGSPDNKKYINKGINGG